MDEWEKEVVRARTSMLEQMRREFDQAMGGPPDPAKRNEEEIFCTETFDQLRAMISSVERGMT